MSNEFRETIKDGYQKDTHWYKILSVINEAHNVNRAKLPFQRDEKGLIYQTESPKRLCIPPAATKAVLDAAHGANRHPGYTKLFHIVAESWYIQGLARTLQQYLKYCPLCQVYQT
jgi:hypothetical protein